MNFCFYRFCFPIGDKSVVGLLIVFVNPRKREFFAQTLASVKNNTYLCRRSILCGYIYTVDPLGLSA